MKSVDDEREEKILFNHELFGFDLRSYDQVIQEMLPWASIKIAKEFYEENYEYGDDANLNIYDEDNHFLIVPETLPEDKIYPYCNGGEEVNFYRLVLTLNKIREAFLSLEDFLENEEFYCIDHL